MTLKEQAEFLLARIAEDKARAQGTGRIAWLTFRDANGWMRYTTVASSGQDPHDAIWIVDGREVINFASAEIIYDERRVLAECEVKRRIVEGMQPYSDFDDINAAEIFPLLALPCADHPDYNQAWAIGQHR
jgi:hypothetical protein